MKSLPLILIALLALGGCAEPTTTKPLPANPTAAADPDARAKQLLQEFASAEDPQAWVQQNTFALTVFQNVKDPAVKAEFDSKIAPLMGKSK